MALFQELDVGIPQDLLASINDAFEIHDTQHKGASEISQASPVHFSSKGRLTFTNLKHLVEEIKAFLHPVQKYMRLLTFFTLHNSTVFKCYLESSRKAVQDSTQPSSITVLEKALDSTVAFLSKLVDGTATYEEMLQSGLIKECEGDTGHETVRSMASIEREKRLLQECSKDNPSFFQGAETSSTRLMDVIDLFQFLDHIPSIEKFCQKFQITGCFEDPNYQAIIDIAKKVSDRGFRLKMTLDEATSYLERVLDCLVLKNVEGNDYKCLDIFPEILKSEPLHQFLVAEKFTGELGETNFTNMHRIVIAQLHSEDHDIMNALSSTFHALYPLMQQQQNLEGLMTRVKRVVPEHVVKQLRKVNMTMQQIQIWFTKAKVSVVCCIHCVNCVCTSMYV